MLILEVAVMRALGAAKIDIVTIDAAGALTCVGPTACDAVTDQRTCDAIVSLQRRAHPDVEVRCVDERSSAAERGYDNTCFGACP